MQKRHRGGEAERQRGNEAEAKRTAETYKRKQKYTCAVLRMHMRVRVRVRGVPGCVSARVCPCVSE